MFENYFLIISYFTNPWHYMSLEIPFMGFSIPSPLLPRREGWRFSEIMTVKLWSQTTLYHRKIFVLSSCKDLLAFLFLKFADFFWFGNLFRRLSKIFVTYLQKKKGLNDYENFKKSIDWGNYLKLDVNCSFLWGLLSPL